MECSIFDLEDGNSEIVTGRYCTVRLTARDSYFTILVKVFNNHIFYRKHKFHRSYRISIEHKIMQLSTKLFGTHLPSLKPFLSMISGIIPSIY